MLRIVYFAWMREAIGLHEEVVDLPPHIRTIDALLDVLKERGDGYLQAFNVKHRIRAALDGEFATLDAELRGAAELALFPPVTGG